MPPVLRRPAASRQPAAVAPPANEPLGGQVGANVRTDVAEWTRALDLGPEGGDRRATVYLGTFARVLAETLAASPNLKDPSTLTREQIRDAVLDAWQNPEAAAPGAGRPRNEGRGDVVMKMLVVREKHMIILFTRRQSNGRLPPRY